MAKTILIVEDEQNIVDILSFNLSREGYQTLEALDGPTGLQLALEQNPDLILLDLMLPGCSGYDVCRVIRVADVEIYPQSWKVYKAGRELKMPNREFELLKFLAEHPNIVFSKDRLFEAIWGFDYVGDSATVTVHVGRIRDKIEDDPSKPRIIETVWGAGYRLNAKG